MTDGLHWLIFLTRPQQEHRVAEQLQALGLATFLPVQWLWRRRSRNAKAKELIPYPLMPRYVLAGLIELPPPLLLIWQRTDAAKILCTKSGTPLELPPGEVERLRRLSDDFRPADHERHMRARAEYREGDMVRVVYGALEGHEARVEKITDRHARIMHRLFGRDVASTVPLDMLEAVA